MLHRCNDIPRNKSNRTSRYAWTPDSRNRKGIELWRMAQSHLGPGLNGISAWGCIAFGNGAQSHFGPDPNDNWAWGQISFGHGAQTHFGMGPERTWAWGPNSLKRAQGPISLGEPRARSQLGLGPDLNCARRLISFGPRG